MTCGDISQAPPAHIHPSHHKHPSVLIQVFDTVLSACGVASPPPEASDNCTLHVNSPLLERVHAAAAGLSKLDVVGGFLVSPQYGDALQGVWTAVQAVHQLFGAASCFSSFQALLPSSDRPVCPDQNS